MKEKSDNWSSPADILQKITGSNSNLDSLVQLREFVVDNLVLNQKERTETAKNTETAELNATILADVETKTD
ncbi:MAG: hypothetical protein WAQ98_29425 [Blastocatellia bacterium]